MKTQEIWQGKGVAATTPIASSVRKLIDEARRTVAGESTSLEKADAEALVARWDRSVAANEPFEFDRRVMDESGRRRVVRSILVPVVLEEGGDARWVGFNLDVTDRHASTAEREAMRDLNRATLESAGMGFWTIEPQSTEVELSPSAAAALGFARRTRVAIATMIDAIDPAYRHAFSHSLARSMDGAEVLRVEARTLAGRRVEFLIRGANDAGVYGAIRDVDDDLRRLAATYEGAPYPVFVLGADGEPLARNPLAKDDWRPDDAVERLIDRSAKSGEPAMDPATRDRVSQWSGGVIVERLGATRAVDGARSTEAWRETGPFEGWLDRVKPRDQARLALIWNTGLSAGERFEFEATLMDGDVAHVEAKPIDGRSWTVGVNYPARPADADLSAAAALDHIRLSLATLESTPKPLLEQAAARLTASERKALADRLEEIGAIRRYVDRLRLWDDLAQRKPRREAVDVHALFDENETLRAYRPLVVEITGPSVVADRELAETALIELLENCRKFSSGGVSILTTPARMTVRDCGRGFPSAMETLTQPLVRGDRDEIREGDGLGLAIVQRVMTRHGGRVELSNTHDGAVVDLFFV